MNIYDVRKYGRIAFLIIAATVVALFLYVSAGLIRDLSIQERERMEIWAEATKKNIVDPDEFSLQITQANHSIPALLIDDRGNILQHRNFDLPEPITDENELAPLSAANEEYLKERLEAMKKSPNVINFEVEIEEGKPELWHLYYEDSKILKRLSYYPYIQVIVMLAFIFIVYYAVLSTKKAEQNKVWVGLSKETAHQLGTPISSLMAWMELLRSMDLDPSILEEMNKDVNRLSTIASRFSKIGSKPTMEPEELNAVTGRAVGYMATRVSSNIALTFRPVDKELRVNMSAPLFEWVMENLIKNAVDAMEPPGKITVTTGRDKSTAWVEVEDTGRGISRKNQKTVFNPGYTTKKRGWGLGLTLAKRIIDQYHSGHIYVKSSTPGVGTTFRIELPLIRQS